MAANAAAPVSLANVDHVVALCDMVEVLIDMPPSAERFLLRDAINAYIKDGWLEQGHAFPGPAYVRDRYLPEEVAEWFERELGILLETA